MKEGNGGDTEEGERGRGKRGGKEKEKGGRELGKGEEEREYIVGKDGGKRGRRET